MKINKSVGAVIVLVLLVIIGFWLYQKYGTVANESQSPTAEQLLQNATTTMPEVSPEKKAIVKAILDKMTAVMETGDAKKIRTFTASIYTVQADKDALAKVTDEQILQSAKVFKDFNIAEKLTFAFYSLPESAWEISADNATITQETADGLHKTVFTVKNVGGIWK